MAIIHHPLGGKYWNEVTLGSKARVTRKHIHNSTCTVNAQHRVLTSKKEEEEKNYVPHSTLLTGLSTSTSIGRHLGSSQFFDCSAILLQIHSGWRETSLNFVEMSPSDMSFLPISSTIASTFYFHITYMSRKCS